MRNLITNDNLIDGYNNVNGSLQSNEAYNTTRLIRVVDNITSVFTNAFSVAVYAADGTWKKTFLGGVQVGKNFFSLFLKKKEKGEGLGLRLGFGGWGLGIGAVKQKLYMPLLMISRQMPKSGNLTIRTKLI